jgi:hypothetical protein
VLVLILVLVLVLVLVVMVVVVLVLVAIRFSHDTRNLPSFPSSTPFDPQSRTKDDHDHEDDQEYQEDHDRDDENETLNRYRAMLSPTRSPSPLKPSFSR